MLGTEVIPAPKAVGAYPMTIASPAVKMRGTADIRIALSTKDDLLLLQTLNLLLLFNIPPFLLVTHASRSAYGALGHDPVVVLLDVQVERWGARVVSAASAAKDPFSGYRHWGDLLMRLAAVTLLWIINAPLLLIRARKHIIIRTASLGPQIRLLRSPLGVLTPMFLLNVHIESRPWLVDEPAAAFLHAAVAVGQLVAPALRVVFVVVV